MALGQNNFVSSISGQQASSKAGASGYLLGRVAHVVYGPFYPGSDVPDPNYNDPTDLGKVFFQLINSTQSDTSNSIGNQPAKPFYSWMKQYPVQGEFVYIVAGPGLELNVSTEQKDYYYLPPFSLWGAANHNALPNLRDYGEYVNAVQKDYQQNQTTNQPSNLTTSSIQYPLGDNFFEKANVKSLEMFVGDVAFEGRYGASIRFASSLASNKNQNYWWDGPNGNPITIIRNGQGKQIDQEGWIPTIENINTDPSSIYLTNGQVINIDDLKNFSLASFGVDTGNTTTVTIPMNQQLTSIDSISPNAQDQRINNENPNTIG